MKALFIRVPNAKKSLLNGIGIASAIIYIYIEIFTPTSVNRIPQGIMILSFFVSFFINDNKKSYFGISLVLASLIIPYLLFFIHYMQDPTLATEAFRVSKLAKLCMFIPLGWWLYKAGDNGTRMLLIAFCGFFTALLSDPNLPETLLKISKFVRVDFGIWNAQHTAMFFGISVISILTIGTKLFTNTKRNYLIAVIWLTLLLMTLFGVLACQTRGVWLGLIAALVYLFPTIIKLAKENRTIRFTLVGVSLVTLYIAPLIKDATLSRFNAELTSYRQLIAGDLQSSENNSTTIRLKFIAASIDPIMKRFFTGGGAKIQRYVIDNSPDIPIELKSFGHFHNSYIEFLLSYGIFGLLFVLFIMAWANYTARKLCRLGALEPEWVYFVTASTIFMLIINFFESYLFRWSGAFVFNLAYAPVYAAYLRYCQEQANRSSHSVVTATS